MLAAMRKDPYRVNDVTGRRVLIERPKKSVERSEVVLISEPRTLENIQQARSPLNYEDAKPEYYQLMTTTDTRSTPIGTTNRENRNSPEVPIGASESVIEVAL